MLFHPFAGQALGLGELVGGHQLGGIIPVFLCALVALRGRKAGPHVRKHEIPRHT